MYSQRKWRSGGGVRCGLSSSWQSCGEAWLGVRLVLSPWLWFWWVIIATGSACLCRRCAAGNGPRGGLISGQGQGRDNFRPRAGAGNNLRPRAREKHELSSAGVFPPRGKLPVVIADVLSPLAEHLRPSRSNITRTQTTCVDLVDALGLPDRDPFSIRRSTQMDQNGLFVSTECVGRLKMPLKIMQTRSPHTRARGRYYHYCCGRLASTYPQASAAILRWPPKFFRNGLNLFGLPLVDVDRNRMSKTAQSLEHLKLFFCHDFDCTIRTKLYISKF
jgi:hypothetical protein